MGEKEEAQIGAKNKKVKDDSKDVANYPAQGRRAMRKEPCVEGKKGGWRRN